MSAAITIIGNVNVDLVMGPLAPWPQPGTEVVMPASDLRVGGAAGNAALALAALGVPYRLIANRGDDIFGRWLAEPFGRHAARWSVTKGATTISVGVTHPDGERTFLTTPGHVHDFDMPDVLAQLPERAGSREIALVIGCFVTPRLMACYRDLMAVLRDRGFSVALDTGWPDGGWTDGTRQTVAGWLDACDHLLINDIETRGLSGEDDAEAAAGIVLALLPKDAVLIVKRGADGAVAYRGVERFAAAAPVVTVIDTIGAGDAFNAGYLGAAAVGASLRDATAAGVAVASLAVSTHPRRYVEAGDLGAKTARAVSPGR